MHKVLLAYVKRREQAMEFVNTCSKYLDDDIGVSQAFDLIQLKLVSSLKISRDLLSIE